ncbi:WXG100 family type VII secretion target [Amycolatopsis sp. NPDC059657]|uniref:WXG100 family type VII secretion target n=1 Tax=Amycolatopsis sp. NPDC059657 TaxID=3346899 RepID=UPI00366E3C45
MAENPVMTAPSEQKPNPLVKTDAADKQSPLEGAGIVQDFGDAFLKCKEGDWTEGLVNAGIGLAGVKDLISDPLAALAGAGIGWLIEHVSFLREPLNWLTGDQITLENMSGTWEAIGDEVGKVAEDLGADIVNDTANWTGDGADAYRAFATDRAQTYSGMATGAQAVSTLIMICQTILNIIRSVVRDLIAECVGKLISLACRYPGPALVAGMLTEGVPMAVKWCRKIIEKIKQLTKAFENGKGLFKKLGDIFERAERALKSDGLGKFMRGSRKLDKEAHKAGINGMRDIIKDFKEVPKKLAVETGKEVGKKVGEKIDETGQDEDKDKPEPIFEQPCTNRISGSIK